LSSITLSREQRLSLLAAACPDELIEVADRCLARTDDFSVVVSPQVGCISAQVREPIMKERFLLADVLGCRAEVELNGVRGWAMRLGDDRAAVLAMAVLDAAAAAGPELADGIDELCGRVAERIRLAEAQEWDELAATVVEFEEL
jgi:alpha-D-ribose 1-methylphosphonate 5-triphosphate synthase subunit PhnG